MISDKEIFPYSQHGTPVSFTALFPLDASKKTATELFPCDSFFADPYRKFVGNLMIL